MAMARRLLDMEPEFNWRALETDFRKHLVYRRQILKVKSGKLEALKKGHCAQRGCGLEGGAETARRRKKNKRQEFLDDMAGEGLAAINKKQEEEANKEQEGVEGKNEKDSDEDHDFLDDMAGIGMAKVDDAEQATNVKSEEKKEKAEANNFVRSIESRENNCPDLQIH
eukprot:TRINITY_DN9865_c0_g2_i1.p1 TRINITY_DN9865_c0_g2~~TRINITY_DN9865_c0_g2_i1.p1  ORF type:complete len:168 (-),score=49.86 TRINITY_DN9865_c0_g2_i1:107-610(-)